MSDQPVDPPVAPRRPEVRELHGTRVVDDYAWMAREPDALRRELERERAYYDAMTAHSRSLVDTLFAELSRRVVPTDESVKWRHADYFYYTVTVAGKQYREFCRRPVTGGDSAVVLDENAMADGADYFALGVRELSPDGRLLAYSVDTDGDEVYELHIRDISSGADLADVVPRSYYGCAWAADSSSLLYVVHDAAYRPFQVVHHTIGEPVTADRIVYQEDDERFDVTVEACRSGEWIVITSQSRDTSELRLLPASDLSSDALLFASRRRGIEYAADHLAGPSGGTLYVVTNDEAPEFRLMRCPVGALDPRTWEQVGTAADDERLVSVDAFAGGLVLSLRSDFGQALRVLDPATGTVRHDVVAEPAGSLRLAARDTDHEPVRDPYDSTAVTIVSESLVQPPVWESLDLATGQRSVLKATAVPGHDPADYVTERLWAATDDDTAVPMTVATRRGVARDGSAPALLYGYGSYEACLFPEFDASVLPLLDRGMVYAVAHIRGGGEGGRSWWQQGRLHAKPTTFTDFVAAAHALADQRVADGERIVSRGLSAGGLLQGAALSMAPERFRAVVAEVPFVDVVNTMLDRSIPLTVTELDEWGDPEDPDDYVVMASYSPYENVPTGRRPDLLVTGSVNDARVMVHEPAKWVARLRATDADGSTVLFRPELGSGAHVGPSGRYDRLHYEAEVLAFVLESVGLSTAPPAPPSPSGRR